MSLHQTLVPPVLDSKISYPGLPGEYDILKLLQSTIHNNIRAVEAVRVNQSTVTDRRQRSICL